MQETIKKLQEANAKLRDLVGQLETKVKQLQGDFKDLNAKIAEQNAKITTQETRIASLEGLVEDLAIREAISNDEVLCIANSKHGEDALFGRNKVTNLLEYLDQRKALPVGIDNRSLCW